MNITVDTSHLDAAVRRQLSVIGKRAVRKGGDSSFSVITPSSAEVDTLHDYYLDAVTLVNTSAQYFVTASTSPNAAGTSAVGEITLTFPTNHNNQMNTTITVAFTTFLVAYAVYAWLSIVEPSLVERYKAAMREKLEALVLLIFHKTPPNQGYTDSLPPMVSTPGDTLTLSPGEQQLMAYTLGSDQVDDLRITSTLPTTIVVAKNANNQIFTIYNANIDNSSVSGVVSIYREDSGEELARISVTAIASAGGQASIQPVIIGYNPMSDTVNIEDNDQIEIRYGGVIDTISVPDETVSVINDTEHNKLLITGLNVGSTVVTFAGNRGKWIYTLYVNVYENETDVVYSNLTLAEGEDVTIDMPFDGAAQTYQMSPLGYATFDDDMDEQTITISGVAEGDCTFTVTETDSGDKHVYRIHVTASQQADIMPQVYGGYSSGDAITLQNGYSIHLNYYPGSRGTVTVSSSDPTKVLVTHDSTNHEVILDADDHAVGNATITFANSTLGWTFTLSVSVVADAPAPVAPTMQYAIGAPSAQNPLQTLNYFLSARTSEDIYVKATGGSGATLYATSSDSSKLSVTRSGDYYVIHPITGTASVMFTFDDYTWTINNTKPLPATPPIIDSYSEGEARGLSGTGDTWSYVYTPARGAEDDVTATSSDTSIVTVSVDRSTHRITVTAQTSTPSTATVVVSSQLFELTEVITFTVNDGSESSTEENKTLVVGNTYTFINPYPDGSSVYVTNGNIATCTFDSLAGEYTITGLAAGTCDVIITEFDSERRHIIHLTVTDSTPTPTPTPTVRYQDVTINVGGDVTYALPFGASAQTYQMSPTGIATFSDDMDELTITIYGNVAGSCQLAVTETDSGDQYIYRITVTSSGGGGGISPFDGLPSSGAIYGYITGDVNVDPGVNITNPVIKIDSSGNVSACCKDVSGSDYLVRYNEQTGEIEYNQYGRVGSRNRAVPICTKAINEASDNYSVVLVEASPNYTHDNPTISFFM